MADDFFEWVTRQRDQWETAIPFYRSGEMTTRLNGKDTTAETINDLSKKIEELNVLLANHQDLNSEKSV